MKKKGYISNSFITWAKRRNIPVTYKTVVLVPYYDGYKNVLTQDMITKENIKYVIKHDYWLNGETITVPENSILEFDGGTLHDGTIIGQNTFINDIGGLGIWKLFAEDIIREGTWRTNGDGSFEQVQSDWNQTNTTRPDFIKNKPKLANVATSGSYNDLNNKPTIPEGVTVDTELSEISTNPVQNKVITKALDTDKSYNPTKYSGLGRKTLKLKKDGSNILTQEDFDAANTIYVIQYDFVLGEDITIPEGCVLDFEGGSLSNRTLVFNDTEIISDYDCLDCRLQGTVSNTELCTKWLITPDSQHIQDLLDVMEYSSVLSFENKTYVLEKNTELPSSFTPDPSTNTTEDQPCLMIRNDNIRIEGNGAILEVKTHAQGILEVFNAKNVVVENLILKGYGLFIPNYEDTGRGEKGTGTTIGGQPIEVYGKYYTTGFWEYYKNNSYDTSKRIDNFGEIWGTFGGGFIGNVGIGLLIYRGSENVTINNVEVYGFNGGGIRIGFLGDVLYQTNEVSNNVKISNCIVHNCYNTGVSVNDGYGFTIDNCTLYDIGAPDAKLSDYYHDPGYGFEVAGTYIETDQHVLIGKSDNTNGIINGCHVWNCNRKGLDLHQGRNITITDNDVHDCVISGIYAVSTSENQVVRNILISNNRIVKCGCLENNMSEGAIMIGESASLSGSEIPANITVENNSIVNSGCLLEDIGMIFIYRGKGLIVRNNSLFHTGEDFMPRSAIVIGASKDRLLSNTKDAIVEGNVIMANVWFGIVTFGADNITVKDNIVYSTDQKTGTVLVYCNNSRASGAVIGNILKNKKGYGVANAGLAVNQFVSLIAYDNQVDAGVISPASAGDSKKDVGFDTISVDANGGTANVPVGVLGSSTLMTADKSGEIIIALSNYFVAGVTILGTPVYFTTDSAASEEKVLIQKNANADVMIVTNNLDETIKIRYKSLFDFNL